MTTLKKIGAHFINPPAAVWIGLLPISAGFLLYSFLVLGTEHPASYAAYICSAYTLLVWCLKIPSMMRWVRRQKKENRYWVRWSQDVQLRVKLSLFCSVLMNGAYAAVQLTLGIIHDSFWFYSLAMYYLLLVLMRILLFHDVREMTPGKNLNAEWRRFRFCGWLLAIMTLALMGMVFFISYVGKGAEHYFITTIALAAYTFTVFTRAVVNLWKYRRYHSPVFAAAKVISFVSALVSMLMLETAMFSAFGDETARALRAPMTLLTGTVVCFLVTMIAVYMIVHANRQLKSCGLSQERNKKRQARPNGCEKTTRLSDRVENESRDK